MNFVYLIPFAYFFATRLRAGAGSLGFHAVFEWLAAAVLVCTVGFAGPVASLRLALLSYLAFISLYEIGYLVNDLFSAPDGAGKRQRGPQGAGWGWVVLWCAVRITVFGVATYLAGQWGSPAWWSFFVALILVFALHNALMDRELKASTFIWLAWFRFMAPVTFALQDGQRMGIGLAAAMGYVSFRLFGYLDGKGLLKMPGRQRPRFRLFYFVLPLVGVLALWPYDAAQGLVVLLGYYALAAAGGTLLIVWRGRISS